MAPSPWAKIRDDQAPPPDMSSVWAQMSADQPKAELPASASTRPHVVWNPPPDGTTPPEAPQMETKVDLHKPLTQIFAPSQPNVVQDQDPMNQMEGHAQNRLLADQRKDVWNPSEHGFWGKFGHYAAKAGNIAGDIVAPSTMALIPGTDLHRQLEERGLSNEIQGIEKQRSEQGLQGAQAGHLTEETKEMPGRAESEEGLQDAETEEKRDALNNPSLAVAYSHAVNQSMKEGRDPAQDPVVQHLSDAITGLQKQAAPKGRKNVNLQDEKHQPYGASFDESTGKYYDTSGNEIAKPVPYEKPISINPGNAEVDREAGRLGKPYEKGVDAANTQLEKIDDARNMINGSAESQALGLPKVLTALVSGQGSGVRITQAELNMIGRARGLAGDVQGTLNSWAGKGKLTPTQQQQLTKILDDVKTRILAKQEIHSHALDAINGARSREEVISADKLARQQLGEVEKYGFYTGQQLPNGAVVKGIVNGKIQVQ